MFFINLVLIYTILNFEFFYGTFLIEFLFNSFEIILILKFDPLT